MMRDVVAYTLTVAFSLGLGSLPTMGQAAMDRMRRGGGPDRVHAALGLEGAQIEQWRAIREAYSEALAHARESLLEQRSVLQLELDSGSTDPTIIGAMTLELHSLRGETEALRSEMKEAMGAVLTDTQRLQWEAVDGLRASRRGARRLGKTR